MHYNAIVGLKFVFWSLWETEAILYFVTMDKKC